MPGARRKSSEPQTPPATPQRRRKRNGSQGSFSSQNSLSSQISLGSQKYTAYLRERPTPTSIYSQEKYPEELQLETSQPSILNPNCYNDNNDNEVINDDGTNQFIPNLPTDRGIVLDNNNNDDNNNNNNSKGLFRNFFNFSIDLFTKLLNPIWFTISIIKNLINFVWNRNRNNPTRINNNNNNRSSIIRWLLYLFFFVVLLLLLLTFSNVKFGQENKSFMDYFFSSRTYKIQPVGKKNDGSIIVTADEIRQIIRDEVKNYMNSENGKHSSLSNEPLLNILREEVKNIVSLEIKDIISSVNRKNPTRRRGSREEETSIIKLGGVRDEKALKVIRNEARIVVKEELQKYSQDKLNRRDFALHSGGAKIFSKYTSKTYEQWPSQWYKQTFAYLTGKGITRGKPPVTAISHDTNVGQCWPMSGQEGQLAIFLDRKVYVTAVTYDHISKDIATDNVLSAPKDFEVWGIIEDSAVNKNDDDNDEDLSMDLIDDFNPRMESTEDTCRRTDDQYDDGLDNFDTELRLGSSPLHLFLGKFTYNINDSPIQTFEVPEQILKYNKPIRTVIMKVLNNWGKPEYTCLYRFRVHGEPAIPAISAEPKIK